MCLKFISISKHFYQIDFSVFSCLIFQFHKPLINENNTPVDWRARRSAAEEKCVVLHLICSTFMINTSSFLSCVYVSVARFLAMLKSNWCRFLFPCYCWQSLPKGIEALSCNFPIWNLIAKRESKFKVHFTVLLCANQEKVVEKSSGYKNNENFHT